MKFVFQNKVLLDNGRWSTETLQIKILNQVCFGLFFLLSDTNFVTPNKYVSIKLRNSYHVKKKDESSNKKECVGGFTINKADDTVVSAILFPNPYRTILEPNFKVEILKSYSTEI